MDTFIGIDISKATFDSSFAKKNQQVFDNNLKGFKKLHKQLGESVGVVMEASGPYYVELATFLYDQGVAVFVVNPLKIKRFSQMNFTRAKTDKKDAELIRFYGEKMADTLDKWKPEPESIKSLKQLNTAIELLLKQINQTKNQLHALESSGFVDPQIQKALKSLVGKLNKEKCVLEEAMIEITNREYKATLQRLISIPGIGLKTAVLLIAVTGNFEKFEHYKQLIAFVGLSPRIYQSGTSVKGKAKVCKMGNAQVRKLLYMCSLSAKKYNKPCKEMSDRLTRKGKHNMVVLIAIANKLIKQAFAIAKSETLYDENYQPKVCF